MNPVQAYGTVVAVSRRETHSFSKIIQSRIRLVAGLGVDSDAHQGERVKHRSRVARDPTQPDLRQVSRGPRCRWRDRAETGVMSVVLRDGDVVAGDTIGVELPAPPFRALEVV